MTKMTKFDLVNNPTPSKKPKKLKLRPSNYPTMEELQPFINRHNALTESSPDDVAPGDLTALSSRVPSNAEAIKSSEVLRKQFPKLFQPKLKQVTDFFLEELSPVLLAVPNGLQDAADILQLTFDEEVDTEAIFTKITNAVNLAVDVRLLNFAVSLAKLDDKESKQFFALYFAKETKSQDGVSQLLNQILNNDEDAKRRIRRSTIRKEAAAKVKKRK